MKKIDYNAGLIALAVALGVSGFMFAVTQAESARNASPEYWHYRHHNDVGAKQPVCDDKCTFIKDEK